MKPLASGEVSFQFNRCRARCLDPNTWGALPLKQCPEIFPECIKTVNQETPVYCEDLAKNFELTKCEGIAGFFVEDIATEIRPKMGALNGLKKDYCD